jgi:hypothetical protein
MNEIEIKGLDQIYKVLEGIPAEIGGEAFKKVAREIGNKEVVPSVKKELHYSAKTEEKIKTDNGEKNELSVYVSPVYKAFFLRFLEFGTQERKTNKRFKRGKVTAAHNLESAYSQSIEPVQKYIQDNLSDRLILFVNRLKSKR